MRRRRSEIRETIPDPLYNDLMVTRLINSIMWDGKKAVAQKVVYGAFDVIREKTGKEPLEVFKKAMDNIQPVVEVKPRRVGGATYQVPVEVTERRKASLGIRWLIKASRSKKGRPMKTRLSEEILAAYENTGNAVKKREDTHKMAEANRAFAHFKW
ncbi:MAG TPA: 30S ribosomal protein S7 [Thermotogota bacterium]|nr:30S ribosomal protein S7 [Thermotogota bacterium]NLH20380.1 30S ribosomal protein S7 [Thermotogaceae bacterium]OQC31733.1 MAG: 30S ribosomal protein S7 [Thermotogota bacterium ADurb.Bin062]HNW46148.1 30S ribosomal protein S7 [Thermotogota bacterium]HNY81520.1 30S ribosomal protein S7 [Thermotogota bacterium]